MGTHILKDVLIIFLISIPLVLIFQRFRLPPLLGFLLSGALIGPRGIGLIHDKAQVDILAELGVTLLLFSVGLEFSFDAFAKVKRQGILSGILQISLTILAGLAIGYGQWGSLYRGVFFGCIIALSSTAVVFTTLYGLKMLDSVAGRLTTVILILQDLALIPMLVFLPWLATFNVGVIPLGLLGWQSLKALILITAVGLFTRFLAEPLLHLISRSKGRELFLILVISLALGMSWFTHALGLSYALGAFLGGIMVGSTEYQYQALSEINPFRICFNSLFFVSIGMLVNFEFLAEQWLIILLLIFLIPCLKFIIASFSVWVTGIPLRLALFVGIVLSQIGEFSFLLSYMGLRTGAISPLLYQLIISIAVVLMLITPLMIQWGPRLAEAIAQWPGLHRLATPKSEVEVLQQTQQMKGHVIVCGFGPLGQAFGNILKQHDVPFLVLELNPETIEKVRKGARNAFYGDGASEEILFHSGIDHARLLAITVPDFLNAAAIIQQARQVNPTIKIITRAKYRNEVEKLYAVGADIVVSEELEGGLEMGRYALKLLDVPEKEVDELIQQCRAFGSADFF
jgi:CPA2 family monovalent cation:H+ antiporter-2